MSVRLSRLLPLILAILGVFALLFFGWQTLGVPLRDYGNQLDELRAKVTDKQLEIARVRNERIALERFEALSLPGNPQDQYVQYLWELLGRHGFQKPGLSPGITNVKTLPAPKGALAGGKKDEKVYTTLTYRVDGTVSLANLVAMFKEFSEAPLLQRIKSMTVRSAEKSGDGETKKAPSKKSDFRVAVQMEIEALLVEGAHQRPNQLIGPDERLLEINAITNLFGQAPGALALAPWIVGHTGPLAQALAAKARGKRDYALIDRDNIFLGYQRPLPPLNSWDLDFKLLTPPKVTLKDGEQKEIKITVSRGKAFDETVSLELKVSKGFAIEPTSFELDPKTKEVTVAVGMEEVSDQDEGTITVTASGGDKTHKTTIRLEMDTVETPEIDLREYYKLIHISKTPEVDEAWLYCAANNNLIRLKVPSAAYNSFQIKDLAGRKVLVKGKVLKIDPGMMYFQVGTQVHVIRRGENMLEATRKSVSEAELFKPGIKDSKGP
jgi:hypothetical protein